MAYMTVQTDYTAHGLLLLTIQVKFFISVFLTQLHLFYNMIVKAIHSLRIWTKVLYFALINNNNY